MAISRYFPYAFGVSADDLTAIPDNAAIDGSVSYQDGWTQPYELNLLTNPAALPIPRGQMNQLFYDITLNIKEYQEYGTPQWVTGNTVQYPIYARVYYSGVVYENQVANNTVTPGTDDTWLVISGGSTGLPIGTVIDFAGPVAPSNFLLCDGSAISRTTYAALLSTITQTQNGTLSNGLNTVSGLSDTSNMYVGMSIEGTNIPAGTTIATIPTTSSITMSQNASGSGTSAIKFFSWGNGDGSTTFNLPDQRRRVKMGLGGTGTSTIGNATGQFGGVESHTVALSEIPNHTHGVGYWGNQNPGPLSNISGTVATAQSPGGINGYSVQTALSLMQPANVYTQCIKYQ